MANPGQQKPDNSSSQQERYTLGYGRSVTHSMQSRTATSNAAFFLPHLRPRMKLLDCGCGPGTITIGLAEVVAPGQVVGIDIGEAHIEEAKATACAQHLSNVSFQAGSLYEIPLPDESFDAVFAHAVLEHLHEPLKAMGEMYRVLKSGGVGGVRSPDRGDLFIAPHEPILQESLALIERARRHHGGNPLVGRELRGFMTKGGFARVHATVSCEVWATPERTRPWSQRMAGIFLDPPIPELAMELGWADRATLEAMVTAWQRWGERPDAHMIRVWCEVVGWKE